MEDTESVAAEDNPSPPLPSASSTHLRDPLTRALRTLFLNVTSLVQRQLQAAHSEYELLERMNLRVASEHDHRAEFAQGLRVSVERLKQTNHELSECIQHIEEFDQDVTELEALVSTLDNYTTNLESKITVL